MGNPGHNAGHFPLSGHSPEGASSGAPSTGGTGPAAKPPSLGRNTARATERQRRTARRVPPQPPGVPSHRDAAPPAGTVRRHPFVRPPRGRARLPRPAAALGVHRGPPRHGGQDPRHGRTPRPRGADLRPRRPDDGRLQGPRRLGGRHPALPQRRGQGPLGRHAHPQGPAVAVRRTRRGAGVRDRRRPLRHFGEPPP